MLIDFMKPNARDANKCLNEIFQSLVNEKTGVGFCNVLSKECLKKGIKISNCSYDWCF